MPGRSTLTKSGSTGHEFAHQPIYDAFLLPSRLLDRRGGENAFVIVVASVNIRFYQELWRKWIAL
jgi:hypothetical protein